MRPCAMRAQKCGNSNVREPYGDSRWRVRRSKFSALGSKTQNSCFATREAQVRRQFSLAVAILLRRPALALLFRHTVPVRPPIWHQWLAPQILWLWSDGLSFLIVLFSHVQSRNRFCHPQLLLSLISLLHPTNVTVIQTPHQYSKLGISSREILPFLNTPSEQWRHQLTISRAAIRFSVPYAGIIDFVRKGNKPIRTFSRSPAWELSLPAVCPSSLTAVSERLSEGALTFRCNQGLPAGQPVSSCTCLPHTNA